MNELFIIRSITFIQRTNQVNFPFTPTLIFDYNFCVTEDSHAVLEYVTWIFLATDNQ